MKLRSFILLSSALVTSVASAQSFKEGYVETGGGSTEWPEQVAKWAADGKVNADDNFYISRVKPRARFRNAATQVRPSLDATNDKRLVAWLPVNNSLNNALPDGVFDSECFTMWSYVDHWGNWSSPIGRIPAAFLDVAHKNGVAVSGVAGIPNANINNIDNVWGKVLPKYAAMDPLQAAAFFRHYGIDGMGYNSEFSGGQSVLPGLRDLHAGLVAEMRKTDPVFENIWYDGTNDNGLIRFDYGLIASNSQNFGDAEHIRTSLFFNYNWNKTNRNGENTLLPNSVVKAEELGRNPLDLYAGVNMQGNEPATNNWPLLAQHRISIGLWGAHERNMFWESRGEKGSQPLIQQDSYRQRIERWFTGGTRNPANCPEIINSNRCIVENYNFHGMSSLMTARSPLSWNLSEEPFITCFNVGNGRFFNYEGQRQHDGEWYNISAQDYQPTWHYWFASRLLGRDAADVPATGLDATTTWDDAWLGGSTLQITGNTSEEYLHLFKTEYGLKAGDVVTLRYKLRRGQAGLRLALTAKGSEATPINEGDFVVMTPALLADEDVWQTATFTLGDAFDGKELALVALHFQNARDLDLLLGEFSIVRGTYPVPAQPVIARAETLSFSKDGLDAKVIWNMAEHYNIDNAASFYKVYAQQEGGERTLMGVCTSWADLIYHVPVELTAPEVRVRYGVSAVSLDHKTESAIAWSDYETVKDYTYCDDITIDKTVIKPGEPFTVGYVDPLHESASWTITDAAGQTVYEGEGTSLTVSEGLERIGSYNLVVKGMVSAPQAEEGAEDTRVESTREFVSYIQVSSESIGAIPQILTLTANGAEGDIDVKAGEAVTLSYTGRPADGTGSQGVDLKEERFGVRCADLGVVGKKDFSVAFWLKINQLAEGESQLFSVADKLDVWPKTDWGWFWVTVNQEGKVGSFTFRGNNPNYNGDAAGHHNDELQYRFHDSKIPVGVWAHIAFVFDYDEAGNFKGDFYINGVKQEISNWKRSTTGEVLDREPGYQPYVYSITEGQVLAIAGSAHGRSGIDGTVDNLIVWDEAVDAATIQASMTTIDPNALADNVCAFWDIEQQAGDDYTFTSAGKQHIPAGMHSYEAMGGEGQGRFHWIEPAYSSGCPFVEGSAYAVVTRPVWTVKKAVVTPAEGATDEAGSASAVWSQGGEYAVTLTLENSLGSDTRTIEGIRITVPEGITDLEADVQSGRARIYIEEGQIRIAVPASDGTLQIFNTAGVKIQ